MKHFLDVVERFNTDKTSAHIKRLNEDDFEIIITPKENILKDCGIKHFNKFEDYKEWLWRKKNE